MVTPSTPARESLAARFERVLSAPAFRGLKAILDCVSPDRETQLKAVLDTRNYEELMARLGHPIRWAQQVHVLDAYSRKNPEGGVRHVLEYNDIPTHSSRPTVVNLDDTVTTTRKSGEFFDAMLATFKAQLKNGG